MTIQIKYSNYFNPDKPGEVIVSAFTFHGGEPQILQFYA